MATTRPVRAMDLYAEQFWNFTKSNELRLQRCTDCGKFRWPPGPSCDRCLSDNFEWAKIAGKGKILSWTTFRRGYFPEYPPPHTAIALELDEGPLFVSYPIEVEPSELREGMPVELRWEASEDRFGEYNLPVFAPARS